MKRQALIAGTKAVAVVNHGGKPSTARLTLK
jgi:hypothetical protein